MKLPLEETLHSVSA